MSKYKLLDISLKQPFANQGITQRVPYTLPAQDDDVNWLEGFTDAYQRPVIADLGQQSGRYIKMGQLNQILNTTSDTILKIKQGLNNISETISGDLENRIQETIKNSEVAIKHRPISWLKTSTNQTCAGLKNFTGVNDNNFGTSLNAVANLKYCNGYPEGIKILVLREKNYRLNTSLTITNRAILFYGIGRVGKERRRNDWIIDNVRTFLCTNGGPEHYTGVPPTYSTLGLPARKGQVVCKIETGRDSSVPTELWWASLCN